MNFSKRAFVVLLALVAVGWLAWRLWRGPSPEAILASLDVPSAPELRPEEELATFRTAPGFRVELVAAEPLVVDPVAMDWDDDGRLYVVEMRGYMPDIHGDGEDAAVGQVVILDDTDGDGRMDESAVFLDGLVLPRAVAVVPEGVLVAEPPNLWLCRDADGDDRCDEKIRLTSYAEGRSNPEHQENGLLVGVDGWIYNARSERRFRFDGDTFVTEPTEFRGQFGIAQDDDGRLYYNHNSGFLYGDAFPADYLMRQPGTAARSDKPGVSVPLTDGEKVWGIRVAAGLNRAYLSGTLRPDGRQAGPTAVSGLTIQRGEQYGPEYVGDAFVPEPGGSAVARFSIDRSGTGLSAEHQLYEDPEWEQREFLASTHERFRPVDVEFGPDGAIWVLDMYRGVIQHAEFVSDHLRTYVDEHALEPPGETGRIWRIVRGDRPIRRRPPPLGTLDEQVKALDHPNGWVRDRASRRIASEASPAAPDALRRLEDFGPHGRRHALWALSWLGQLDRETWRTALRDPDPGVRVAALRAAEASFGEPVFGAPEEIVRLAGDEDPSVGLQALLSLGALPVADRPLDWMLAAAREGDELTAQAVLSGLSGRELEALGAELQRTRGGALDDSTRAWLEQLGAATHLAAQRDADPVARVTEVLDLVDSVEDDQRVAVLSGIVAGQRTPAGRRVELEGPHPLFAEEREWNEAAERAIRLARPHFTWPGDPRPGGARALSPAEERRRAHGRTLFVDSCAACHGSDGRGIEGQAPSLVGSPWVRDSDDWLVRIVLDGITGPIEIDGKEWDLTMPGHGDDTANFGDEALAGLLTYVRRSWGHAEDPVSPETVARIRSDTAGRRLPWTAEELRRLPVTHRLDRYVGAYRVPVVGTEMVVVRQDSNLAVGQRNTGKGQLEEAGPGLFLGNGITIQFEEDEEGGIEGAQASYGGMSFPVTKTE